jgi:hypothetical protein
MKAHSGSLLLALALSLTACGQAEEAVEAEDVTVQAQAVCYAYLLDNPNFTGPLNPFPVIAGPNLCVNLPAGTTDRTSSFRLSGCKVRFFDGFNCTGAVYGASTSGVMPLGFNNRASSLIFN